MMNIPLLCLLSFGAAVFQVVAADPLEVDGYVKHEGNCEKYTFSQFTANLIECAKLCNKYAMCLGFVFNDTSKDVASVKCKLKHNICSRTDPLEDVYFYTPSPDPLEVDGYVKHEGNCQKYTFSQFTANIIECAKLCNKYPMCLGFVFDDTSKDVAFVRCKLKHNICSRTDPLEDVYFYTPSTDPIEMADYVKYGGECPGGDLEAYVESPLKCAARCNSLSSCVAFAYFDTNVYTGSFGKSCLLKSHICTTLNPVKGAYFYTQYNEVGHSADYVRQAGKCAKRDAIYQLLTSFDDCAARCTGQNGCTGFEFIDHKVVHNKRDVTCILRNKKCLATGNSNGWDTYIHYYAPLEVKGYTKREGLCPYYTERWTNNYLRARFHYTSLAGCAAKCNSKSDCKGFGFYDLKAIPYIRDKTCALKTAICEELETHRKGYYTYVK